MRVVHVRTLRLARHVVNLQGEDRQAVDGPRRGLGVEPGAFGGRYVLVFVQQVGVHVLHHVRTVLIRFVDAALDEKRLRGVDGRVADNVLQVPLHRVDPVLVVEQMVDRARRVGIVDGMVHIVPAVILLDGPVENTIRVFGKHSLRFYSIIGFFTGKSYLCR